MTEKRIQLNQVIENQLPTFVKDEFPLISSFLKQYYISQEFEGGPSDLIQNIDRYIKIDNTTNKINNVGLKTDISFTDSTILVDTDTYPAGTDGFPKSYGLLKIDDEIITYTGTSSTSFTGCVRGFVGISSYTAENDPEQVVFNSTTSEEHTGGTKIDNLSSLFLNEFLKKTKKQLLPGLSGKDFSSTLNENIFIKQSKDFYNSRGTDKGFKILFKALYDTEVEVSRPGEFTFRPSDAYNVITDDLVVEPITGNPKELELATLFEPSYGSIIDRAYAPITSVEEVSAGIGITYYRLSVDAGYNRDIGVRGSTYGTFVVHPKTKLIGSVSSGATTLTVDSTVGFGTAGELRVTYNDETVGTIEYTDKTLTEFYGCSGIVGIIDDKSTIGINTVAYGASNLTGENIEVRICSVLSSSSLKDQTQQVFEGSVGRIQTLGDFSETFETQNWINNISQKYKIKSFELKDGSNNTWQITFNVEHNFRVGDKLTITGSDSSVLSESTITSISDFYNVQVLGQGALNSTLTYSAKRSIKKASYSGTLPSVTKFNCNVQNIYKQKPIGLGFNDYGGEVFEKPVMVASGSLPEYQIQTNKRSVTFSGTFSGAEIKIISSGDHGFYTGDAVYYTPEINASTGEITSFLFDEGLYFVRRLDSTRIAFSRSVSNIYNSKFLTIGNDSKTVGAQTIESYDLRKNVISTQKLLRKFALPKEDIFKYRTVSGSTGLLVNGVEIENYKSTDFIKYGKIESIDVVNEGDNYDIVFPPPVKIKDTIGVGASAFVTVEGGLKSVDIVDPGYDYQETPVIVITGGNGDGAKASVAMRNFKHFSVFPSSTGINTLGNSAGIGLSDISVDFYASTIGFSTYHKFRNNERVVYSTSDQTNVAGLTTNAAYYVSVVGPSTVRLHNTFDDCLAGINTVYISGYGIGEHSLQAENIRTTIQSITVDSVGSGYANKKKTASIVGINTSVNIVKIKNHTYESGDIVKYTTTGTAIGGLTDGYEYYVTKTSDDAFRLSQVASGSTVPKDVHYQRSQYIDFTTVGVGTHIFNYPAIQVDISSKVRQYDGGLSFPPEIRANFKGTVKSIHLSENGVGYGSSEVLNFDRQPDITLVQGSGAQITSLTFGGVIKQVIVINEGSNYSSAPLLDIEGDFGVGAVLVPILEDGKLVRVNVIEGGEGYADGLINVIPTELAVDAVFNSNIQTWNVNLFEKINQSVGFNADDGYVTLGLNYRYGLQYKHIYAPRKLRESLYSVDSEGKSVFGSLDLAQSGGLEVDSIRHSPIIGWAYDGNPIYGPYGYAKRSGGSIGQIKSGYSKDVSALENRPPISTFGSGFFIEDYVYKKVSDEDVLDENNGRFCVTPEFPKGTYAYFSTLETTSQDTSSAEFAGYKKPMFPYIIGEHYKSVPEIFNFKYNSNQDDYDLVADSWSRNTVAYNLIEGESTYDYVNIPNKLSQTITVTSVRPGVIESIGISSGGYDYQVNDEAVFDIVGTQGSQVSAKVSELRGVGVSSVSIATSSIPNTSVYPGGASGDWEVVVDDPHHFVNTDLVFISGVSTTTTGLEGFHMAGISSNILNLIATGPSTTAVGSAVVTGFVTHFSVSGNIDSDYIKENDILKVGSERVRVLNVLESESKIRVLRAVDNTVGTSHSVGTTLIEDPRRLIIDSGIKTTSINRRNRQLYFEPETTVGIGTSTSGRSPLTIGIGVTIDIPDGSLYIPSHNLLTGDKVTYDSGNGGGLKAREYTGNTIANTPITLADNSTLYVARISDDLLGLSTTRVGLSNTTGEYVGLGAHADSRVLYFTGIGTGVYHSIKNTFTPIFADLSRNIVTVSTASTHGLSARDDVVIDVNPSTTRTVVVKYDDFNRRMVFDPKNFVSGGITVDTDTIEITGHGFVTGDKVLHTATSPTTGLADNTFYYVYKVDEDNFRLSSTRYDSTSNTPIFTNLQAPLQGGTLSLVNPPLTVYRDSTITFNLSDSSLSYVVGPTDYSAFTMKIYSDEFMTKEWDKAPDDDSFKVTRNGKIGVDSDATLTLSINSTAPGKLFYKFTPIYESNLPIEKEELIIDYEVYNQNGIEVKNSLYNGKYLIYPTNDSTFTYTIDNKPEASLYESSTSTISYKTNSTNAFGEITKFEITNRGRNFYSLPQIVEVSSGLGTGAAVSAGSSSIGKVQRVNINDIGYDFPSDQTLKPSVLLNQNILIEPLYSIESIGITSVGKGYTTPPKLLCYDPGTQTVIDDVDLTYKFGDSQVTILKNSYGIGNRHPTVVPIENSNGVGISTITYDPVTKVVKATLNYGFSVAQGFPFAIGDKVLVENLSVGVGSTAPGYNCEGYDYKFFEVSAITPNFGGIGDVSYDMTDVLGTNYPGEYDSQNSSGRIINVKDFPLFEVITNDAAYSQGETVTSTDVSGNQITGLVNTWDAKSGIIRISSNTFFVKGKIIKGLSSKKQSKALTITAYESLLNLDAVSKIKKGVDRTTGILNLNSERLQDSWYYQNFSYTLKSNIPYETWNIPVSSLSHTLGFKRFSDYQLESTTSINFTQAAETHADVEVTSEIPQNISLHTVYDFDLVTENSLHGGFGGVSGKLYSNRITFGSKILDDYIESVGNRVLSIDNIADQFDSNPRPEKYSKIHDFDSTDHRAQKYITFIRDTRFTSERQLMICDVIHDNDDAFINQYASVGTIGDLGSLDVVVDKALQTGEVRFYPTNYSNNNYKVSVLEFVLDREVLGIGSTSVGDTLITSNSVGFSSAIVGTGSTTIVGISSYHSSLKVIVQIAADSYGIEYEYNQLNITHNGTDINVLEYGRLNTDDSSSYNAGLGTYHAYYSGSNINVDFYPSSGVGIGTTAYANTITIGVGNTTTAGISTLGFAYQQLKTQSTVIGSSGSPGITTVCSYPLDHDGAWFMAQVHTGTQTMFSEVVVVDDHDTSSGLDATYDTEFGIVETSIGLGTFGSGYNSVTNTIDLHFTPIASTAVKVNVFASAFRTHEELPQTEKIDFTNGSIQSFAGYYEGTIVAIKKDFPLKYATDEIFTRSVVGSSSTIVDISTDQVKIPNHYFVSGEEVTYTVPTNGTAIGIGTTTFTGFGSTDLLPSSVHIIKYDNGTIKFARTAADALAYSPIAVDITSLGVGIHTFTSKKKDTKTLIAVDNMVQAPIVSTAVTTHITSTVYFTDNTIVVGTASSLFSGDLIKIGDEIMRVNGISGSNISVYRGWMGTGLSQHNASGIGSVITKMVGDYAINGSTISFADAPVGKQPLSHSYNNPDERDWVGITSGSTFHGRVFLRTGAVDSSDETYTRNMLFDDISDQFDAQQEYFNLKVAGIDTTSSFTEGVILVNGIAQIPGFTGTKNNFTVGEVGSATTITFSGTASSITSDPNTTSLPIGGRIVSTSFTGGYGYMPLVAAGATSVVSAAGTIESISIGNSGSGYRSGIQTVNVGVQTFSNGIPNIEIVGVATVSNGNIIGVAITNPGIGYTRSNVPTVVFDSPLSYSNIVPNTSGVGTGAKVDIVVGQGSSVIEYKLTNFGYGYKQGDTISVSVGGTIGIPTTSSYDEFTPNEFQLTVDNVYNDTFNAFTMGEFDVIDNISGRFNGSTKTFVMRKNDDPYIVDTSSSFIKLQDTLIIFINGVLQVPGEGYSFTGGSLISFSEAPKFGDTCGIMFYKGSGIGVDVKAIEILQTLKVGDILNIENDSTIGQSFFLDEENRNVFELSSIDTVSSEPYFGPGRTQDETLKRPVTWTRQTEDRVINGVFVDKSREIYEPSIHSFSYVTSTVGVGATIIYVDSVRPFFNPLNEDPDDTIFQNEVTISKNKDDNVVAIATAVVGVSSNITSIVISDGGKGYETAPTVIIGNPVGYGSTATATAAITAGVVTSITLTGLGTNYTSIPQVIISTPEYGTEPITVFTYSGDYGKIVGFGTTKVGSANKVWFDLHIPLESDLRDISLVSSASTISGISTGDVFVVSRSNVGIAATTMTSLDTAGNTIGIGISYMDNIYYVDSFSNELISHPGIGNTYIKRVNCRVTDNQGVGIGSTVQPDFGDYSWGKIISRVRSKAVEYPAYTNQGVVGLSTSSYISRLKPLRYKGYT